MPVVCSLSLLLCRLERQRAFQNLSLPLLLSCWNEGKFLFKCTFSSPLSFTPSFYRNEEPQGILLLWGYTPERLIDLFSHLGLSSEINWKRMLCLSWHQYILCSIPLAFWSVIPIPPQNTSVFLLSTAGKANLRMVINNTPKILALPPTLPLCAEMVLNENYWLVFSFQYWIS